MILILGPEIASYLGKGLGYCFYFVRFVLKTCGTRQNLSAQLTDWYVDPTPFIHLVLCCCSIYFVCLSECICVFLCLCLSVCLSVCACVSLYVYVCVCLCICACMYVFGNVCICNVVCVCVFVCVSKCVFTYLCM